MNGQPPSPLERRSFLSRLNLQLASFVSLAGIARAQEKSAATGHWQPARHDKDDWYDQLPGKHRMVFDTTTPEGVGESFFFANNFMRVNRTDYGLQNSDLAVVIIVRSRSTPFAYNDAMWAKYGTPFASQSKFEDPKTKLAPKVNLYNVEDFSSMSNRGITWDSLVKQGLQLAVCSLATHAYAGTVARATGGNVDEIYSELTSNLVKNARIVPAGIVAVNRAQERGYTLASARQA